ncbi:MAG: hypothetical protein KAG14_01265 [Mycoplasmataceae bacterium]|nr:hypothetical protein [Mycoplasmataceae bacterium]
MKKLNYFIIAFVLFAMNATAATTTGPVKPTSQLRAEIVDIIGPNCPYEHNKNECSAEVLFTINTKGELIVLSVVSPNVKAEGFVKSKLNYKKVSHRPKREGEIFLLPLRMVRE